MYKRQNLPVAQSLLGLWFARDLRWPWGGRGGGRLPFDRRLWAARLAQRAVPLLVLHGDRDNVCPLDDGRAIADVARENGGRGQLVIIDGGEHNNLWTQDSSRTQCVAAVSGWLVEIAGAQVATWQSGKVPQCSGLVIAFRL